MVGISNSIAPERFCSSRIMRADLVENTQAQRQPGIDPGALLPDQPCAQGTDGARRFPLLSAFHARWEEISGTAHEEGSGTARLKSVVSGHYARLKALLSHFRADGNCLKTFEQVCPRNAHVALHDDKPAKTCFSRTVREEHRELVRGKRFPGESKQQDRLNHNRKNVRTRGSRHQARHPNKNQ